MNLMLKLMISIMMMISTLNIMILVMSKKSKMNFQKMSSFECGFNSMSKKRLPFSIHFFLLAIIFLIFDIEIIILMPMIFTMKFSMMKSWIYTSFFFVMILIMGLYNEWYNGMLNWTK